jgi:ankyrin repeat protein
VELLLAVPGIDVNLTDRGERSPLAMAAKNGHSECLKLLLAAPGIDVNLADQYGDTPLCMAALYNQVDCLRLLLDSVGVDINRKDCEGKSILDNLLAERHAEVISILRKAGVKKTLKGRMDALKSKIYDLCGVCPAN